MELQDAAMILGCSKETNMFLSHGLEVLKNNQLAKRETAGRQAKDEIMATSGNSSRAMLQTSSSLGLGGVIHVCASVYPTVLQN